MENQAGAVFLLNASGKVQALMTGIMPPTLDTIIETAAAFGEDVFKSIDELIQKPTWTDPSDADLSELSNASNVPEDDLRYFLSLLIFLFAKTEDIPDEELQSNLVTFITENSKVQDAEQLASKLSALLAHRGVRDAAAKRARLRNGLLPNIVGLVNYVDVRNDFKRDDAGNLTGELDDPIVIVQLGIQTDSSKPQERELILQLDERSLELLEECLDETRQKLNILSKK